MKNQNKTSKTVQFFLDRGLRCFGSLGSVVCFVFFGAGAFFGAFLENTRICNRIRSNLGSDFRSIYVR